MKFNKFAKGFKKALQKAIDAVGDKNNLQDIGDELVDQIKIRTRTGSGVDKPEGSQRKFKKLAESTKKSRGYKKKSGYLTGKTTPAKSNLTETGDMVESIHAKATDNNIIMDVSSDQADKAEWNSATRAFLNLSKGQTKKVVKELEDQLVKIIKKELSK